MTTPRTGGDPGVAREMDRRMNSKKKQSKRMTATKQKRELATVKVEVR